MHFPMSGNVACAPGAHVPTAEPLQSYRISRESRDALCHLAESLPLAHMSPLRLLRHQACTQ